MGSFSKSLSNTDGSIDETLFKHDRTQIFLRIRDGKNFHKNFIRSLRNFRNCYSIQEITCGGQGSSDAIVPVKRFKLR